MKFALFGLVLGGSLFVNGTLLHDIDYRAEEPSYYTQYSSQGRLVVSDSNADQREFRGYQKGIIGAGIIALSIKHLWDLRSDQSRRAQGKLRTAVDLFIGASLIERGSRSFDTPLGDG